MLHSIIVQQEQVNDSSIIPIYCVSICGETESHTGYQTARLTALVIRVCGCL